MNPTATEPITRFKIYTLQGILPEGDTLILDSEQSVISRLRAGSILELQLLSPSEFYVTESLITNYPDYCPYAHVLHAMTGKSLKACTDRVNWGLEEGTVDVVMRPVRNLLGRTRSKLRPFGIEVKSLVGMGYMLVPLRGKRHKEK